MTSAESDQCLAVIHQGLRAIQRGNLAAADQAFAGALATARTLPQPDAMCCFPLVTAALCLLRTRQGKAGEAEKLRGLVMAVLDKAVTPDGDVIFPQLMGSVLSDLGEYQRAIPFYEQAAQSLAERDDPLNVARNLLGAGKCYCRSGLNDHGAVPLRAAVRIYRDHPGDPYLSDALLNLGVALARNSPAEAEAAYKEAAAIHEAKLQLESAAPAWVNLGILCSQQDRHAESLAWYQKALRVREQSPGTPPDRLGSLLNNMANCHRRAGNFAEAHQAIDRALSLLRSEHGSLLASAYGTRGLILSDEQRDAEAVEWLEKAVAQHQKMPSPNLESIAINFEAAAISLRRLNRLEEAAAVETRLAAVRTTQQVPKSSIDLSGLEQTNVSDRTGRATGAVLIELNWSTRPGSRYTVNDAATLADRLSTAAQEDDTGFYAGRVSIPESTTLMFYGEDAEALYRVLKPVLDDYLIAEGARIVIRQGSHLREASQPSRAM
jgi:tetratricopeptide (TPR) repeat protein